MKLQHLKSHSNSVKKKKNYSRTLKLLYYSPFSKGIFLHEGGDTAILGSCSFCSASFSRMTLDHPPEAGKFSLLAWTLLWTDFGLSNEFTICHNMNTHWGSLVQSGCSRNHQAGAFSLVGIVQDWVVWINAGLWTGEGYPQRKKPSKWFCSVVN